MSFVVGGSPGSEPSFLELIAVQRLDRSIRDAFSYCLSALADRVPSGGLRLLQHDDVLYLIFGLIVQGSSLAANNASLAESLYGLRRVPGGGKQESGASASLTLKQRLASLVILVAAPYVKHRLLGDPEAAAPAITADGAGDTAATDAGQRDGAPEPLSLRLRRLLATQLSRLRRHSHAAVGLVGIGYQVAYLLRASPFFGPGLHAARVCLVRDSGASAEERRTRQLRARLHLWDSAVSERSPGLLLSYALMRAMHAVGNNAKSAILCTLVLYKALEWWFQTGEQQLQEAAQILPPPPPPFMRHDVGIELPDDRARCPLCNKKRQAPSLLATSGYVFCYKCVFTFVSQRGCCPVTRIRACPDDIRRLFPNS